MSNYYNAHKIMVAKEYQITPSQLERGMIVGFRYKPLKGKSKRYLCLILQPSWYGGGEEKTHALTLANFSGVILNNFAKKWGIVYSSKLKEILKINVPQFAIDNLNPKQFYLSELKRFLPQTGQLNHSYRIFFFRKLGGIYAINYKFHPDVMKIFDLKN